MRVKLLISKFQHITLFTYTVVIELKINCNWCPKKKGKKISLSTRKKTNIWKFVGLDENTLGENSRKLPEKQ